MLVEIFELAVVLVGWVEVCPRFGLRSGEIELGQPLSLVAGLVAAVVFVVGAVAARRTARTWETSEVASASGARACSSVSWG